MSGLKCSFLADSIKVGIKNDTTKQGGMQLHFVNCSCNPICCIT